MRAGSWGEVRISRRTTIKRIVSCPSERLEKEREILEERAEKRVEILKNLVSRTVDLSALSSQDQQVPVLSAAVAFIHLMK